MLRLVLMRHGDAARDADTDHARPLTPHGRAEAASVGSRLVRAGWVPQAVRGSDATRTRQTWEALQATVPAPPLGVSWTRDLYLPTLEALIADASAWPAVATLLCLGHNPGWSDSASRLSGVSVRMGTANAAVLENDAHDWTEAFGRRWELRALLQP